MSSQNKNESYEIDPFEIGDIRIQAWYYKVSGNKDWTTNNDNDF